MNVIALDRTFERGSRSRRHLLIALTAMLIVGGCGKSGGGPTAPPGGGGGSNHNPTLTVNTTTTHLAYGGPATITVSASDPDGDQLTFAYAAVGGTVSSSGPTATTAAFAAGSHWGPASVTVTVSDGKGGTAQATASMYVRNPNPPTITISASGSQYCSYGTGQPDCFQIRMSPAEAVILTEYEVSPVADNPTFCAIDWIYHDVAIAPAQSYLLESTASTGGCAACNSCNGNAVTTWNVWIIGRRPEPDGGRFVWTAEQWHY